VPSFTTPSLLTAHAIARSPRSRKRTRSQQAQANGLWELDQGNVAPCKTGSASLAAVQRHADLHMYRRFGRAYCETRCVLRHAHTSKISFVPTENEMTEARAAPALVGDAGGTLEFFGRLIR